MNTFELDLTRLAEVLDDFLRGGITRLSAKALGESSRETPWRLDFLLNGVKQSALLRYGKGCSANEAFALYALEEMSLPTPRVLCWDEKGAHMNTPLFISEFIDGTPLLAPMKAHEDWAIELYLDTTQTLHAIRPEDLPDGAVERLQVGESAADVLADAYAMIEEKDALIEAAYRRLMETQPDLLETRFSNGDLWPENLLIRDRQLVGIIDWQHAGFSDPLFEFLLPFFLVPELKGLGIEEAFCQRTGLDSEILHWYHGLEFFDSLRWVMKTGKPYEMHTVESLRSDLAAWLKE